MGKHKYALGDRLRHRVTGFEGIAIGFTEWLTNCDRYCIQPEGLTSEGKQKDEAWFDDISLVLVETDPLGLRAESEQRARPKTGGPMPDPAIR